MKKIKLQITTTENCGGGLVYYTLQAKEYTDKEGSIENLINAILKLLG